MTANSNKPRYSRLTDILKVVDLMHTRLRGVCLDDIQKECGVSRRTAERIRDSILIAMPEVEELPNPSSKVKYWGFKNSPYSYYVQFNKEEIEHLTYALLTLKNDKTLNKKYRDEEKIDRIIAKAYAHRNSIVKEGQNKIISDALSRLVAVDLINLAKELYDMGCGEEDIEEINRIFREKLQEKLLKEINNPSKSDMDE